MEGLWSVAFRSSAGRESFGVVVFQSGRVMGGDSAFYWFGTYVVEGDSIRASIEATNFSGLTETVFGFSAQKFSLEISGEIPRSGGIMRAKGKVVGYPNAELTVTLTKRA